MGNESSTIKYASSYRDGIKVEELFQKHFEQIFGHKCFPSNSSLDINGHVDFCCWNQHNELYTFDVKGVKKIQRNDQDCTEDYHWVEIQNVLGQPGWLHGSADYIVFELNREWLFADRKKLIQLVEAVKIEEYAYPPEPYKLYTRKRFGRNDICILMPTSELRKVSVSRLKPHS